MYGQPADMDAIMDIAKRHNLYVIEDCSQAILAEYKGKKVGTIGDIGTFSFQESKHITCGDGGITITNNDELGDRAKLFANKGWPKKVGNSERDYLCFGNNYRMTELQAAVLCAQFKKVKKITKRRNELGDKLTELLKNTKGIRPAYIIPGAKSVYWLYPLKVDTKLLGVSLLDFAKAVSKERVSIGAGYLGQPLYLFDLIKNRVIYGNSKYPFDSPKYGKEVKYEKGLCPNCEKIFEDSAQILIKENFTDKDIKDIATAIKKVAGYYIYKQKDQL